MTDTKRALAAAIRNNVAAPTYFAADASPPDSKNPLVRLNLTPEVSSAIGDFGRKFMTRVHDALMDGGLVEKPYDSASVARDHEIDVIDLASDERLAAAVDPFTKATDARAYSKSLDGQRNFNLTAVAFPGALRSKPVVLLKRQSQPAEIRSERKIRIFSSRSEFDKLEGATFLFDDTFDAAYVGGKLLIFQKERFHIMFGYYDGLKAFVQEALPQLRAAIPIENFAELEAVCLADKTLMKRFRRTMSMIPPDFNAVRFATMIADENIPIKVAGTPAKPTFVFEKGRRHDFFTLLEDGFLKSSATDRHYEANSKRLRDQSR